MSVDYASPDKFQVTLTLPWPPAALSPNSRAHWARKAVATKKYRWNCYWLTRQAGILLPPGDRYFLRIVFHPPDGRKRDDDNMLAAFKPGRDGVANALAVDDVCFVTSLEIGDQREHGAVNVMIEKI